MKKHLRKTAKFVRDARLELGYSQQQMAKLLNMQQPNISRVEQGLQDPTGYRVLDIIEMLKAHRIKEIKAA